MKKAFIFFSCCIAYGALLAAPHFVTPAMIKRQGLTDAQFELLWAKGAHPEVDPSACRNWVFHASRGQNLEEWIGETMGQEDLGRKISDTVETNKYLVARNNALVNQHTADTNYIAALELQYGEQGHELATLKEENYLLKGKYEEAKPAAAITLRIQNALHDEGTLGPYLRTELVSLRDQTTDPKKQEVFDACIELMDSVVNRNRDTDMEAAK